MTEVASTVAPSVAQARSRLRRGLRRLWRWSVRVLAIIGFVTVVRPFVFDVTPMISGSMSPTLQGDSKSGDWVLAEKLSYLFRAPRRWEVVAFEDEDRVQIMKRVAALPGETIAIKDYKLLVNGQPAERAGAAPVKYYPFGNLSGGKVHAAGGGYFVLGDDSVDSQDSRYEGSVVRARIRARAWLIVWPPSRMGWVR